MLGLQVRSPQQEVATAGPSQTAQSHACLPSVHSPLHSVPSPAQELTLSTFRVSFLTSTDPVKAFPHRHAHRPSQAR